MITTPTPIKWKQYNQTYLFHALFLFCTQIASTIALFTPSSPFCVSQRCQQHSIRLRHFKPGQFSRKFQYSRKYAHHEDEKWLPSLTYSGGGKKVSLTGCTNDSISIATNISLNRFRNHKTRLYDRNIKQSNEFLQYDESEIIQLAWDSFLHDFESLPSTRSSKFNTVKPTEALLNSKNNPLSVVNRNEILSAFAKSSALRSLYNRVLDTGNESVNSDCEKPLCCLTRVVGPITKFHLVDMIVRHPNLMAGILLSIEKLKSTKTVISQALNLSPDETIELIERIPSKTFIQRTYRGNLQRTFAYFLNSLSMSQNNLRQVYKSTPQLFTYSEIKIKQTVQFFLDELDFDLSDVRKMILKRPSTLAHGLDSKIKPVVELLRDDLGIAFWRRILIRYPQIFAYSSVALKEKVQLLQNILKIRLQSDNLHIISSFPPLLWLRKERIELKVLFIQDKLRLSEDELEGILVTYPPILGLSIEKNLRPKIEFFLNLPEQSPRKIGLNNSNETLSFSPGAGLTIEELKEFVLYQPSLLGYSLDSRIRPRIQRLKENGILFSYSPPYLMSLSDEKFNAWLLQQKSDWSLL